MKNKLLITAVTIATMLGIWANQTTYAQNNYWSSITKIWQQMVDNWRAAQQLDWDATITKAPKFREAWSKSVQVGEKVKKFWVKVSNWWFSTTEFKSMLNEVAQAHKYITARFDHFYVNSRWVTNALISLHFIDMKVNWQILDRRQKPSSKDISIVINNEYLSERNRMYEQWKKTRAESQSYKWVNKDRKNLFEKTNDIQERHLKRMRNLETKAKNGEDVRWELDTIVLDSYKDAQEIRTVRWNDNHKSYTVFMEWIARLLYLRSK